MKNFDYISNNDLHPGFLLYLKQFRDYLQENFGAGQTFDELTLLDILQGAELHQDDLVDFLSKHPVTDNRTLHAALILDAEGHGAIRNISNIHYMFEAEERDWLFSDKENIGEGLCSSGIAGVSLGFRGLLNPDDNSYATSNYYHYLWHSEWFPGDDESLIESVPEVLACFERLNFFYDKADLSSINGNDVSIPESLLKVSEREFHDLPLFAKAEYLQDLIHEFDFDNQPGAIKLCEKWAIEHGRCLLVSGEKPDSVVEKSSALMHLILDLCDFTESLKQRTVDLFLRKMLAPFPASFIAIFGKLDSLDSLILNGNDYNNGFDYLAPNFDKNCGLLGKWYGLYDSGHIVHDILPAIGLNPDQVLQFSRSMDFREVEGLFFHTNYYDSDFRKKFINEWVKDLKVERVGTYQMGRLHELIDKLGTNESKALFNVFTCKVLKTFGDMGKEMRDRFPVFTQTPEEKKAFIEYVLEHCEGKATLFQVAHLSHEDLKPYWDQLPSKSKRCVLGDDLGL
jgi:hypothetical protein